jgi:4-amino-4-deoxy-L-arabinose transferase-like glycosyltransferase
MNWLEHLARPRIAGSLLLFLAALQLAYDAHLPLHGDEAYYWVWGQHPALSYFDHPPLTAWLLALTSHAGVSELWVRLVPLACMVSSAWLVYRLALDLHGRVAAALALILFVALPVTQMGALLATPDATVILFWSLALYAGDRALFAGGGGWYLGVGAAVGLALLAKYTAILFPAALLVFLLARRREVLFDGRAWLALALAVALFSPVLLWNAQHEWISFAFQYAHGSGQETTLHWGHWWEFVGGCFLSFSPVFLAIALIASFDRSTWRDDRRLYLALFFLLPLAFFLYKGLFKKMEINWVAVAYPAASVMVAGYLAERRLWKTFWVGLALALALSLAIKFPGALGLPEKMNIQNRLAGYREAVGEMLKLRRPGEPLLADHYTTASLLGFYAPDHPLVRIPTPSRFSQYDLWATPTPGQQPHGLYLATSERSVDLKAACGVATLLKTYSFDQSGFSRKAFYFYRCGP